MAHALMHAGYVSGCLLILASSSNAIIFKLGIVFLNGPELEHIFGPIVASWGWNFERTASAISLALEDYQQKTGHLTEHTFKMVVNHGNCWPGFVMKRVFNMYFKEKPDVLLGFACSIDLIPLGMYLSNWNLAVFSHGSTAAALADKDIYSTLVRVHPSGKKMGKAYAHMFRKFGWRRVAMITGLGGCELASGAIHTALKAAGVTITEWIQPKLGVYNDFVLEQYADQVRQRARAIIVCIGDETWNDQLAFLRIVHRKGMRAPDFVFLGYFYDTATEEIKRPWSTKANLTPEQIKEWKNMLVEINFKIVVMAGVKGQKYEDFYDKIAIRLSKPPWNYNQSLEMGWRGSFKAVDVYDVALTYFTVLDEVLTEGGDYRDGQLLQQKVRNRTIHGLRGKVRYDEKADREPDYWLMDLHPGWDLYRDVLTIIAAEEEGKRLVPIDNLTVHWGTVGNLPPPDTPVCGFQHELCVQDTSGSLMLSIGLAAGGIIFILIPVLLLLLYRRQKEEEALRQTVWKVDLSEIRMGKARGGSVANMSQRSMRSVGSSGSGDGGGGVRQLFTEVGTYRGALVAVLRVDRTRVELTQADMKELKAMKDMSHTNLAVFVGACVEPPYICYIMDYYTKGSLQDIIENDIIGLDWMFKTSLLSDLANGMEYLHRSELQSHGSLRSTCCLVDSRWQLKVSSYGLHAFRSGQDGSNVGEHAKYRKLLWTAPELLRMPINEWPRYGTQAGDVYSFGVIAQEVIYRAPPYFLEEQSPKDFISKLASIDHEPYRPQLPKLDENTPPEADKLIKDCWQEEPASRPTFGDILKLIRKLNKNQKVDIMSSLIVKLEKYANNLEEIVIQRTSELVVEKKRTDNLLESMLPPSVVEELKQGRTVAAELFEAVTILFSDIVGFTALSLESAPLDIVNLLNDLYHRFDDIISLHDAYKMETIGDSYMVVSGLPHRNGDQHVSEIANLSLHLMSAALTFTIRHRPQLKLKLRIGFHTGPCAAGVVGLSMPRYCLFGDTVNMASRMETNGKALMIHVSRYAFAALETLEGYKIKERGEMQIKGKGLQMTYWLVGRNGFNMPLPLFEE